MKRIFTFLFAALMSIGMFAQIPAAPVISGDAEFTESTQVTITCATPGATIRYAFNGVNPHSGSSTDRQAHKGRWREQMEILILCKILKMWRSIAINS